MSEDREAGAVSIEGDLEVLAALARCDSARELADWLTGQALSESDGDAAFLWTPDPRHGNFVCTGAAGEGASTRGRAVLARDAGVARAIVRDREPLRFGLKELLSSDDGLLARTPSDAEACLVVPLAEDDAVLAILAVFFRALPDPDAALGRLETLAAISAPVLERIQKAAKKSAGMLHAIERLTNLYDASKTFGATIDWQELTMLIAAKAGDLASAEVGSLWLLDLAAGEVGLAATAVNQSYTVENAPDSVGSSIVGDLLAGGATTCDNEIGEDEAIATENEKFPVRNVLAVPLEEDDQRIGALVLVNKRGRSPEFSTADVELIEDLGRQAVRALRNSRQYEAERKVQELDALLTVSREITATLDLDRVMGAVVNSTSALLQYDRCAISILQRGKLRLGAVSGMAEIRRDDPSIRRTAELLEWTFFAGSDVSVHTNEDGEIETERPETREKFRRFFDESGMRSFNGVMVQDEEGKLGVIGFESAEPLILDEDTRDLLQILVNQATVALRNAQLYQQVPLAGFWKPLLERKRRLSAIPARKRRSWAIAAGIVAAALVLVPWKIRLVGPARILAGRQMTVTTGVEGVVVSVKQREGDVVRGGDVLATLDDSGYQAALAAGQSDLAIAERDVARAHADGNAPAAGEASSRREEATARVELATKNLEETVIRAPEAGVILTPHLDEKIGAHLATGAEFCRIANAATVRAEIAIPEEDCELVRVGDAVALKINAFPTRVFRGTVTRTAPALTESQGQRTLTVESDLPNSDSLLRYGMLGRGKVSTRSRQLGYAIFRHPLRYFWLKIWPKLP